MGGNGSVFLPHIDVSLSLSLKSINISSGGDIFFSILKKERYTFLAICRNTLQIVDNSL